MFTLYLQPNVEIPKSFELFVEDVPYSDPETHMWKLVDVVSVDTNPINDNISVRFMMNGRVTLMCGLDATTSDIVRIEAQ